MGHFSNANMLLWHIVWCEWNSVTPCLPLYLILLFNLLRACSYINRHTSLQHWQLAAQMATPQRTCMNITWSIGRNLAICWWSYFALRPMHYTVRLHGCISLKASDKSVLVWKGNVCWCAQSKHSVEPIVNLTAVYLAWESLWGITSMIFRKKEYFKSIGRLTFEYSCAVYIKLDCAPC